MKNKKHTREIEQMIRTKIKKGNNNCFSSPNRICTEMMFLFPFGYAYAMFNYILLLIGCNFGENQQKSVSPILHKCQISAFSI